MCNYPYSNRDVFNFVSDCHIYQPLNYLFQTIVLFVGLVSLLYGILELSKRTRKSIPYTSIGLGLLFFLTYLIMLIGNLSFADRMIALNLIHGLGRAMIWLSVGMTSFSRLDVIMSIDSHTVAKFSPFHKFLTKFNTVILVISTIGEISGMIIPTFVNIDFLDLIVPIAVTLVVINAVPGAFYAWKLREMIKSAKEATQNEDLYTPLIKQLDGILSSTISAIIIGSALVLCWMYIPALRNNLYIIYNLQMVTAPVTGIVNLWTTRAIIDPHHSPLHRKKTLQNQSTPSGSKASSGAHGAVYTPHLQQYPHTPTPSSHELTTSHHSNPFKPRLQFQNSFKEEDGGSADDGGSPISDSKHNPEANENPKDLIDDRLIASLSQSSGKPVDTSSDIIVSIFNPFTASSSSDNFEDNKTNIQKNEELEQTQPICELVDLHQIQTPSIKPENTPVSSISEEQQLPPTSTGVELVVTEVQVTPSLKSDLDAT